MHDIRQTKFWKLFSWTGAIAQQTNDNQIIQLIYVSRKDEWRRLNENYWLVKYVL